jgi:hypothetical protein
MPVPSYHCLGIWQVVMLVDPMSAAPAIASCHGDLAGRDSFTPGLSHPAVLEVNGDD